MATASESGLCSRSEYERAFHERRQESSLQVGELAVVYFEVAQDINSAWRHLTRVHQLGETTQPGYFRVDIDFLGEDMESLHLAKGKMNDGIWVPGSGNIRATINPLNQNYDLTNGCLVPYEDGFDDELIALMERELVGVRSLSS